MAEKIGFSDPEDDSLCFSLNECLDGVTIGRPLAGDREVLGIMEGWYGKPDAKFIFQCKLYTDGMISSKDPKIVHMLFIQGVYNIISGTYPTQDKEAIALAALQFQARFGVHNPASHKPGFLTSTLVEYLPAVHIETGGKTAQQWEEQLFHKHAFSTSTTPRESYVGLLAKRDYYGAALFAVKQKFDRTLPRKLYIAISRRGILLVRIPERGDDEEGMETLQSYPLADIYRWAYKPGVNFYFEIKGDKGDADNAVYTFETPEGKAMSDLLTDYALALLREMGLNPDGSKRVRAPKPAAAAKAASSSSSSSSSGGAGAASAAAAASPAAAGGAGGPPPVLPSRSAMAGTTDAYKAVSGDGGTLAIAALRSGEYADAGAASASAGAGAGAAAAAAKPAGGAAASAGAGAYTPPPPSFSAPPPPPPPSSAPPPPPPPPPPSKPTLPANWIECTDEGSGDVYYFNQVSGESVWEIDEIPGYVK